MHDNDPEVSTSSIEMRVILYVDGVVLTKVLEREKQRTLSGEHLKTPHINGAPGWNEHLASSSEAFVKVSQPPFFISAFN
jgi:hypothetical protein